MTTYFICPRVWSDPALCCVCINASNAPESLEYLNTGYESPSLAACPVLTRVPHAGQAAAGPSAKAIIVAGAGHGMHGHERECVDAVMALLDKLPRLSE